MISNKLLAHSNRNWSRASSDQKQGVSSASYWELKNQTCAHCFHEQSNKETSKLSNKSEFGNPCGTLEKKKSRPSYANLGRGTSFTLGIFVQWQQQLLPTETQPFHMLNALPVDLTKPTPYQSPLNKLYWQSFVQQRQQRQLEEKVC